MHMMPEKKNYSYTNLSDTPKHGEIIESSYLLGEKEPKSTWTRIFEMAVLLAIIGGCAYLTVFLFQNGNHHPARDDSSSNPHRPVGASSATMDDAACFIHPKCKSLIADPTAMCCPNIEGDFLSCCSHG